MKLALRLCLGLVSVLLPSVGSAANSDLSACRCQNGVTAASGVCPGDAYDASLALFAAWAVPGDVPYSITSVDSDLELRDVNNAVLNHEAVRQSIVNSANTWSNVACCSTDANIRGLLRLQRKQNGAVVGTEVDTGTYTFNVNGSTVTHTYPPFNSRRPVTEPGNNYFGSGIAQNQVVNRIFAAKENYERTPYIVDSNNNIIPVGNCTVENGCRGRIFDPLALAVTLPMFYTSSPNPELNGKLARARMMINGYSKYWYTGPTAPACASGSTICNNLYSLQTVITHEFGHFVGYKHSACTQSVMVTSAAPRTNRLSLFVSDVRSVCSTNTTTGYGRNGGACPAPSTPDPTPEPTPTPTPTPTPDDGAPPVTNEGEPIPAPKPLTLKQRYESCTLDSDCAGSLFCRTLSTEKICDYTCTRTGHCPQGEVCLGSGSPKWCGLPSASAGGTSGSSGSTGTTSDPVEPSDPIPISDFCAPCESNNDCEGARCQQTTDGSFCTAACTSDASCGPLGFCSTGNSGFGAEGTCLPRDESCVQKAIARRGALNEACSAQEQCGPDLLCVQLAQLPVCLERCDTEAGAAPCKSAGYACVEVDSNLKIGVCFKETAREGEACVLPDTSLCGLNGKLLCAGTPAANFQDAACYKRCGGTFGQVCAQGQTCELYPNSNDGVCTPLVPPECPLSELGQSCTTNEECASNLCLSVAGAMACSRQCSVTLQSGCPQNFSCLDVGAGAEKGACFPSSGLVTPAPDCSKPGGGCGGCNNGGDETMWIAGFVVMAGLLRRRRAALAVVAGAVIVASAGPAQATVVIDMSGPELAAYADAIVHARAVHVKTRVTDDTRVMTDVELVILDALKGQEGGRVLPGKRVRMSFPGGETSRLGMRVAGQISVEEGAEYVLYLVRDAAGVGFMPAGMRLGLFSVTRREYDGVRIAKRSTDGLTLVRRVQVDGVVQTQIAAPRNVNAPLVALWSDIRKDLELAKSVRAESLPGGRIGGGAQ